MQSSLDLFLTVMETFESKRGVWDAYGGGGGEQGATRLRSADTILVVIRITSKHETDVTTTKTTTTISLFVNI